MRSNPTQTHNSFARAALAATAAGVAAFTLMAPASAETVQDILVKQDITADCPLGDCSRSPVAVPFTATTDLQHVELTSPGNSDCAVAVGWIELDGQYQLNRLVGPGWQQGPFDITAGPGSHTLAVTFLSLGNCKTDGGPTYGAHIKIWEDTTSVPGVQIGPEVTYDESQSVIGILTVNVRDQTGEDSHCTYRATDPAGILNGSFKEFFLPAHETDSFQFTGAFRTGTTWDVIVDCGGTKVTRLQKSY